MPIRTSPEIARRPELLQGPMPFRLMMLMLLVLAALTATARAATLVSPGEMRAGSLLFAVDGEGRYVEAPRLGTDVNVVVSGPVARTTLTQRFANPANGWVEGVYVFPLPDGAAVDALKMIVGERIIVGSIKERQEAKRVYEEAKAAGKKAALMEQERPNMFTTSLANIGPGEAIVIQIEYQESVRQSGDEFSLRIPLVVGPRYVPAPVVQTVDLGAGGLGWGKVSDPVPDRDRLASPVLDPRQHAPINPVTISVRLQPGFPLGDVKSHHHPIKTEESANGARLITLADGAVPADRDFELTWRALAGQTPAVGLFREHVGNADYLLAYVTPPAAASAEKPLPREIVLVIDNSGSMGGDSIRQARDSLRWALGRLKPEDRFNVVRFDDTFDVLFPDTQPGDASHVATADRFVAGLEANGGTEMVPALIAALNDPRPSDLTRVRQVIFLTDGAIGNERELFAAINANKGRSRIFMVGIGSAPNTHLMTQAAEIGRGTFTHIGETGEVEARMRSLFEKLESPAVTSLAIDLPEMTADITPSPLPDLYRGEPLVIAIRADKLAGSIEVRGLAGETPWVVRLPVAGAAAGSGISKLWARRRIIDEEVAGTIGNRTQDVADKRILALALEHHLVSRLTSLVALDQTPSRPAGTHLSRAELPLNLPAGWDFDKVFGEQRSPVDDRAEGTPGLQHAALQGDGLIPASAISAAPRTAANALTGNLAGNTVAYPATATDAELRLLIGLVLLAASLLLLLARRTAGGRP